MTASVILFLSVLNLAPLAAFGSTYASWQSVLINGASPGLRSGHVGVTDLGSDAAIFFGGHAGDLVGLSDVWRFSFHGQFWTILSPSSDNVSHTIPGGRFDHCGASCSAALTSPSSRVSAFAVFFGGASDSSGGLWDDIWSLSFGPSSTWSQLRTTSAARPSPRASSACRPHDRAHS